MPYDLSQFPLRFDNAKHLKRNNRTNIVIIRTMIAVCAILNIFTIMGLKRTGNDHSFWMAIILPWVFPGGLLLLTLLPIKEQAVPGLGSSEPCTLTLDDRGVHLQRGNDHCDYPWQDIQSVTIKTIYPPGHSQMAVKAIQIRRKGQFIVDKYADLIDQTFGVDLDDLNGVIHLGMEKWGGEAIQA